MADITAAAAAITNNTFLHLYIKATRFVESKSELVFTVVFIFIILLCVIKHFYVSFFTTLYRAFKFISLIANAKRVLIIAIITNFIIQSFTGIFKDT